MGAPQEMEHPRDDAGPAVRLLNRPQLRRAYRYHPSHETPEPVWLQICPLIGTAFSRASALPTPASCPFCNPPNPGRRRMDRWPPPPPTVPILRMAGDPTRPQARQSRGANALRGAEPTTSLCVATAPTRAAPLTSMAMESGDLFEADHDPRAHQALLEQDHHRQAAGHQQCVMARNDARPQLQRYHCAFLAHAIQRPKYKSSARCFKGR